MQTQQTTDAGLEQIRLQEDREGRAPWKKWGPYLSERQWGTVREDYSSNGDAWNYFTHDQAQFRAYRWGEDGLAGISDNRQLLCFALALWNGKDPILKERLFGLSNGQGNHGEDVKECYFYLDSTPTHSYMKYLYKYPQAEYPYQDLIDGNRSRDKLAPEYELLDTGIFDQNRYFDVFVEYAKAEPEDVLVRITVWNRGPEPAEIHVLPTLWFRNTWSWGDGRSSQSAGTRPSLNAATAGRDARAIAAKHSLLGDRFLYCEGTVDLLFTENETNTQRAFGQPNQQPYCKDGIGNCVVKGDKNAVNPKLNGTRAAAHYRFTVPAGGSQVVRLRLTDQGPDHEAAGRKPSGQPEGLRPAADRLRDPFGEVDATFKARQAEADAFYEGIRPKTLSVDEARVMRQALAGMLWSKQFFYYDVAEWLREHGDKPEEGVRVQIRNRDWFHMYNADVISMPDKWEYPWYAVWDLGFHAIPLALVDVDFAKEQLRLFLGRHYLHPSGQMPAYEWNFGDVNPPIHPWAVWVVYNYEKQLRGGRGDLSFLKFCFTKLSLNFTWWVNRKDVNGNNVFSGGFLGLDNIGVFDRSSPLPTGGHLEQSDGTSWMAFFASVMLQIAIELAVEDDPLYEAMALKYFEHYLWIASAMDHLGSSGVKLWDHGDGFFYDVLRFPDGNGVQLKVRSLVGLLPLAATTVLPANLRDRLPRFFEEAQWFLERHPQTSSLTVPLDVGAGGSRILSLVNPDKLRRMLRYMLDEKEFLSEYGIRSLSRCHADHPYVFNVGGQDFRVAYVPGDSDSGMFGGNSNWRGPIWMPMQLMLIRGLANQFAYLGEDWKVECPVGSGRQMNLLEVSQELTRRLSRLFIRNRKGRRPAHGSHARWNDPHWRDHVLFYEYFHGDSGAGIGASHQTGWTGVIAFLMQGFTAVDPEKVLERGMSAVMQVSALVAQEVTATGEPEQVQIAEAVHEQVAEKIVSQVLETVQQQVTEAMQGEEVAKLQEKVEGLVMEKVAEAVQKKAEEVQQQAEQRVEEKKDVL